MFFSVLCDLKQKEMNSKEIEIILCSHVPKKPNITATATSSRWKKTKHKFHLI